MRPIGPVLRRRLPDLVLVFALLFAGGVLARRATMPRGDRLPDFDAVRLDGRALRSADLRGKVVLLNVWASWCAPCREELPALDSLARTMDTARVRFVAISDDTDPVAAREFLHAFRALPSLEFALGLGRLESALRYPGLPYSLLLDAGGRIVRVWTGFGGPPHLAAIAAEVAELTRQ